MRAIWRRRSQLDSWLLFSNFQKDLFQENLYISVAFHKGIEVHQQLTRVNLLYKDM